eukprot:6724111-Prymnesium_polylepis.1
MPAYNPNAARPSIGNKRPRSRFVDDAAEADGEDDDDDELSPFEGQEEEASDLIDDSDDDGDDADSKLSIFSKWLRS